MIPSFLKNKPTSVISEVLPTDKKGRINPHYPADLQCKSGHTAEEGSRFFRVSGSIPGHLKGLYCENCIKAMHILRRIKRDKRQDL